MSIEHPPYHGQARVIAYRQVPHASNVVQLHETAQARQADQLDEELLAALSPLLDEVDGLRAKGGEAQDARNFRRLLEENAKLRRLAVKLSNLLGDLPKQSA